MPNEGKSEFKQTAIHSTFAIEEFVIRTCHEK